jgi:crotonobetainyl-CoA:carnitine CoA-transferase CaiB-like acyl-CoA transferase
MPNYVVSVLNGDPNFVRSGSGHPQIAPYQAFLAADGRYIVVGAFHNTSWQAFCRVVEREDLLADERFKNNSDRVVHKDQLVPIVQAELLKRSSEEWVALFEKNEILAAPVLSMKESFAKFGALNEALVTAAQHSALGALSMLRCPISIDGASPDVGRAAPVLGEHTNARLRQAGYSQADIDAWNERKLV